MRPNLITWREFLAVTLETNEEFYIKKKCRLFVSTAHVRVDTMLSAVSLEVC